MKNEETWRTLDFTDGLYAISSHGRVMSYTHSKGRRKTPRILKGFDRKGYLSYKLYLEPGTRKYVVMCAHNLVCRTWHGEKPDGHVCRHLDGEKANNHWQNLAWGSDTQNKADMELHGTRLKGERLPQSRLTEEQVKTILVSQETSHVLAEVYGVWPTTIESVRNGKTWNHITGIPRPNKHLACPAFHVTVETAIRE